MVRYGIRDILIEKMRKQGVKLVKKGEIKAVHDDDLIQLLASLEVYEDVKQGNAKCHFCSGIITMENIECVFPLDNEVKFCCNKKDCNNMLLKGSDFIG